VARMSADARRAELLQAALRVMSRDGIAAGTTRAIVAEAGMPLATFHYCFRSRNELLRELITLVTTMERQAVTDAMTPSGGDFRETLRQALRGYVGHLAANPGHELFLFELNHYALRTPELHDLADEQYRRYYETATAILEAAADLSDMEWKVDLPVLARFVVTLIDGATTTWLADRDTDATLAALDLAADHVAALATPRTRSV
jgi:TetR/AcrR family transcriptional regulator, regulator of biofilm formation and stress response